MSMKDFFSEGSPYFNHPLLTAERTATEVDFLQQQWDLQPGAAVLDVGCGFGRHSIELARRGYQVVGIDPSAAMITKAKASAIDAGVTVDFQQVSGQDFRTDQRFEAAVCLFTTLGQMENERDNQEIIDHIADLLQPGGWLVVEVAQRETAARKLLPYDRFGGELAFTEITREYNPKLHMVQENFHVVEGESEETYRLRYRLYSFQELREVLSRAGFIIEESFADYEGQPLTAESERMLLAARKSHGFSDT